MELLRAHLRRKPADDVAQLLMGTALLEQREFDAAVHYLERAVAAQPADVQRWMPLARALRGAKGAAEALPVLEKAAAGNAGRGKGSGPLLTMLGDLYEELQRGGDAAACYERAMVEDPAFGPVRSQYAVLLMRAGRARQAAELMRQAVERNPRDLRRRAVMCFYLNYVDDVPAEAVFAEHRALGQLAKATMPVLPPLAVDRQPERRLKLGLMSGDFRQHSVAYFVEPLLDHLDRAQFEIVLVTTTRQADEVTARLRAKADAWVEGLDQDFAGFAHRVRGAGADVLVDLAGLTASMRSLAMASRLAPVQATYLGYPNTTGVPGIDLRIVDERTDPPGAEALATERLVRLPECFIAYRPDENAPEPRRTQREGITFGSFNNAMKLSPSCLRLWGRVLERVPGSRLLLKAGALKDAWVRGKVTENLSAAGIDPARVEMIGWTATLAEHLALYERIDVALDTTPYNGTTTTCEALWMGVPVVSLAGRVHAGRVGCSLLGTIGRSEWAAENEEAFVQTAASLAGDPARLDAERASLRGRMRASPLCDGPGFAARFGAMVRAEWRAFCQSGA